MRPEIFSGERIECQIELFCLLPTLHELLRISGTRPHPYHRHVSDQLQPQPTTNLDHHPSLGTMTSPPPPASQIRLYAELLLHIRSVTLHASLQTQHTHETKATLAADGRSVTLTHEGATARLRLPTTLPAGQGGDASLVLPEAPPAKELSLRLRLDERDDPPPGPGPGGLLPAAAAAENRVPWGAGALNGAADKRAAVAAAADGGGSRAEAGEERDAAEGGHGAASPALQCRRCATRLLAPGRVREWRDLPSENWAEMMEFWHCHKPHEPGRETAGAERAYAAGRKLVALEGVGFVDLVSFLLAERDCTNLKVSRLVGDTLLLAMLLSSWLIVCFLRGCN
jgi:ubiquitin-protein ligase E3 D